jgi:hypothetical protein
VVGQPFRETPVFRSTIDNIVVNPTWTVPPGILAKDILPTLRRNDRSILTRKRLSVIDRNGNKLNPAAIDFSRYSASNFPFMLRQDAGPDNALGVVKINFPNPHLVYLHDTPSKTLFNETVRAFSSGCIRTERPLELAEMLLADPVRWDRAALDAAVAAGDTRTLRLAKKVPVLIILLDRRPRRRRQRGVQAGPVFAGRTRTRGARCPVQARQASGVLAALQLSQVELEARHARRIEVQMGALEAHGGRRTEGLGEGRLERHAALFAGHACGDRGLDGDPSGLGPELIPRHHAVASRVAADPALGEGQDHGLAVVTVRYRRALPIDELPTVRLEPTARLGGREDGRGGGRPGTRSSTRSN